MLSNMRSDLPYLIWEKIHVCLRLFISLQENSLIFELNKR